MQPAVWHVMSLAGIAGFFWGAVLYELIRQKSGAVHFLLYFAHAPSHSLRILRHCIFRLRTASHVSELIEIDLLKRRQTHGLRVQQ